MRIINLICGIFLAHAFLATSCVTTASNITEDGDASNDESNPTLIPPGTEMVVGNFSDSTDVDCYEYTVDLDGTKALFTVKGFDPKNDEQLATNGKLYDASGNLIAKAATPSFYETQECLNAEQMYTLDFDYDTCIPISLNAGIYSICVESWWSNSYGDYELRLVKPAVEEIQTDAPTSMPSSSPTTLPSSSPTIMPSISSTNKPTRKQNRMPSNKPSKKPSKKPTSKKPTKRPSKKPTIKPSNKPTINMPIPKLSKKPTNKRHKKQPFKNMLL